MNIAAAEEMRQRLLAVVANVNDYGLRSALEALAKEAP